MMMIDILIVSKILKHYVRAPMRHLRLLKNIDSFANRAAVKYKNARFPPCASSARLCAAFK